MNKSNQWLNIIKANLQAQEDVIPEGWKTIDDLCAITGNSTTTVRRSIKRAVESDQVIAKIFRRKTKDGRVMPILHYLVKK